MALDKSGMKLTATAVAILIFNILLIVMLLAIWRKVNGS